MYSTASVNVFPLPADALYIFSGGVCIVKMFSAKLRAIKENMKYLEDFYFNSIPKKGEKLCFFIKYPQNLVYLRDFFYIFAKIFGNVSDKYQMSRSKTRIK